MAEEISGGEQQNEEEARQNLMNEFRGLFEGVEITPTDEKLIGDYFEKARVLFIKMSLSNLRQLIDQQSDKALTKEHIFRSWIISRQQE